MSHLEEVDEREEAKDRGTHEGGSGRRGHGRDREKGANIHHGASQQHGRHHVLVGLHTAAPHGPPVSKDLTAPVAQCNFPCSRVRAGAEGLEWRRPSKRGLQPLAGRNGTQWNRSKRRADPRRSKILPGEYQCPFTSVCPTRKTGANHMQRTRVGRMGCWPRVYLGFDPRP